MSGPLARRGFLRGLAGLPLVGGAVTLIGQPTAAAVPATPELLEAYRNWLHMERRMLAWEMAEGDPRAFDVLMHQFRPNDVGALFHDDAPPPSTRAAVILSTAGVALTGGRAHG